MQSDEKGETARKLLEPGDKFGDYTVEKLLGKGGMGAVYLVRTPDGERYAVKLMFPEVADKSPDFRTRFAREAEFAMKIRHKNLISVYDVGEDPDTGYCYIVMDYVPGGSVKDRIAATGALPIAEAVSIAAQVALALEVAHRHGVIHRDIKPDNIMFDADGTPKLADLGVAKFTDDEHTTTVTTTGMIIGTPAYMAPEQMMDSRHIDARADIYALGVVLFEMLTGRRPTEGSTAVELLAKALKGEPLPDVRTMRPEVSAAIAHVLSLMCAPKPEGRPDTTLAVAQLLQKAATGRLVLPKKAPRAADAQKTKRPFPVAACVMGAIILGAALFGWRAWSSRQNLPTATTDVSPAENGATGTTGISPAENEATGTGVSPAENEATGTGVSPAENGATGTTVVSPAENGASETSRPTTDVNDGGKPDGRPKPLTFDLGDGVKMELVGCPAGTFTMGFEGGNSYHTPHKVTISRPFWAGKYPVTRVQWDVFMPQRKLNEIEIALGGSKGAVSGVARREVEEYCRQLTKRHAALLPKGYVFRLPTLAESEYFWRAGSADANDPYSRPTGLTRQELSKIGVGHGGKQEILRQKGVAWDDSIWKIPARCPSVEVGLRKPNAWGIFDLAGNLDYWLMDMFPSSKSESAKFGVVPATDIPWQDATDPLFWDNSNLDGTGVFLCSRVVRGWGDVDFAYARRYSRFGSLGFRIVAGPDLLRERGIALSVSRDGPPASPAVPAARGGDASAAPTPLGEKLPKESSPHSENRSPSRAISHSSGQFELLSEKPRPITVKLGKGEQLELMGCPAGTFTMGYEGGGYAVKPHQVKITRPFWLGKFPVTRAQWECLLPSIEEKAEILAQIQALGGGRTPQTHIRRQQVNEFFERLNRRYAKSIPRGLVFRLPTLAEWEYACRANGDPENDLHARPTWGNVSVAERVAIAVTAREKIRTLERQHVPFNAKLWEITYWQIAMTVGTKRPNAWGICDMLGNQAEIVLDTFSPLVMRDVANSFKPIAAQGDLDWRGMQVDPLFWNEDPMSASVRIATETARGWGEAARWFMKGNNAVGYCDGFRVAVGPDLVKERHEKSGRGAGAQADGSQSVVVIFPRAETQTAKWKKRAPWRYTTKVPTADWAEPTFRDGTWKRTNKPVGHGKDAALMRIADRWTTSDIWLRRHFSWKTAKVTSVTFDMIHDENVEIYLNGTRILEESGMNDSWEPFDVPVDTFLSAVREGDNVLAVKVHDSNAARYFDCGMTVVVED